MPELSELELVRLELMRRELAKRSFLEYLRLTNGKQWVDTKFGMYLATEVQKFIESDTGNAYDILVIEVPPQHGKSTTVTEALPAWALGKYPDWRVIIGSYNEETAERFARRNKEKVANFGENIFKVKIGAINRATEFELEGHRGRLISRGVMGGVTGNPANLMIIDDAIKNRAEADSPTTRAKLWDEWTNSFRSRLAAGAKVIAIGTPWHESDYLASLLNTEQNIRLIRLPVEAEPGVVDPLGREPGDPLCPELGKDKVWLEQFKTTYLNDPEGGMRAWTALYMCSPRVEGGNLIRREWWKYYDPEDEELQSFATEFISVDAAFKNAETNDFVAIEVWSKRGSNYYCRYCMNRHLSFSETVEQIRRVKALYPHAQFVLVEDKANGSAIIDVLQREMLVIPVNPRGGKVARVNAISAAIESGHVYLPRGVAWVEDFVDQFSVFPAGEHDDMCFVAGTKVATPTGDRNIEDLRPGDKVLTPFGVDEVVSAGCTGEKQVVERIGLTGTVDHPVFVYGRGFVPLARVTETSHVSVLGVKEAVRWKYRRQLCSTERSTGSWGPDGIISVSQRAMKDGDMRKDFMSRCGNFTADGQYRKAMRFITSTATVLITSTATWSAYRVANSLRRSAHRSTRPVQGSSERRIEKVYNLTTKTYHLYYAGGILVHNCDAASQALLRLTQSSGVLELPDTEPYGAYADREEVLFLDGSMYEVYDDPFEYGEDITFG